MSDKLILQLEALKSLQPEAEWVKNDKEKLLCLISASCAYRAEEKSRWKRWESAFSNLWPAHLAAVFGALVLILTSGTLTVAASQSSLPGEPLYPVKRASERMALAVASEEEKPKLEIEQAGRRLEEIAELTQKTSDAAQHEKVAELMSEYESQLSSANDRLTKLNQAKAGKDVAKLAATAQVVTTQSDKYTEVLKKTTDTMPEAVKAKVSENVADAKVTSEKVNVEAMKVVADAHGTPEVTDEEMQMATRRLAKIDEATEALKLRAMSLNGCEAGAKVYLAKDLEKKYALKPNSGDCVLGGTAEERYRTVSSIKEQLEEVRIKLRDKDLKGALVVISTALQRTEDLTKELNADEEAKQKAAEEAARAAEEAKAKEKETGTLGRE